jgi:hypothetical protein
MLLDLQLLAGLLLILRIPTMMRTFSKMMLRTVPR